MAPTTNKLMVFPDQRSRPEVVVVLDDHCWLHERGGYRVVSVGGLPLAQLAAGDRMGKAHAMVSLIDLGWGRQGEVARAFGCSGRTARDYAELGINGRPSSGASGTPRMRPPSAGSAYSSSTW
jgi:hypothetical protein